MRPSNFGCLLSAAQADVRLFSFKTPCRKDTIVSNPVSLFVLLACILLIFGSESFAQSPEYEVTQIPVQNSGLYGILNDSGVAAGVTPAYAVWMWEKDVGVTYLPDLGGPINEVLDINDNSIAVGRVRDNSDRDHACFWQDGTLNLLNAPPNYRAEGAIGINSAGTMVGYGTMTYDDSTVTYSFISDGSISVLTGLPRHLFNDINDNNFITGIYWSYPVRTTWFNYHEGSVTYLAGGSESQGWKTNNRNHVLGMVDYGLCLWRDGISVPLTGMSYWDMYGGVGINDYDVVVGFVNTPGGSSAVIWDDGGLRYLDDVIDPNLGLHLRYGNDINNKGEILCTGSDGFAYLLRPNKAITIRDARNDVIPNVEFNLIKVMNDVPFFNEDTLGSFTTDSYGRLDVTEVSADTFEVDLSTGTTRLVIGDSLKFAKHVHSVPAMKHQGILGTMYSVHLDNAQFADDGHMYFKPFSGVPEDIVLNHTELRYNLLVSVGWEATYDYLQSLEDNFSFMSDYLYDVTDGQLRLDTVYIIDNGAFQSSADIIVYASNFVWPCAYAAGILSGGSKHIFMPRFFAGDSASLRNYTDQVYPLNLTALSTDYRAKAHEFGHYALGFYDEYLFKLLPFVYVPDTSLRCLSPAIFNYGFMDRPYENTGVMSSEMSGAFRYEMASCQNTHQWGAHGMSCWDHFERWVEATLWGPDNLFAPILKPSLTDENERVVSEPAVFFAGPNNNMAHLDYHVGFYIEFPNIPLPQAPGYSDKHITVRHPRGGDDASLRLINDPGTSQRTTIYEGRTSDAAGAWVVGVKDANYEILVSKGRGQDQPLPRLSPASPAAVTTDWLYGIAQSGGPGVSRLGNRFAANSAEDSITVDLTVVQGYYPLICSADLLADGVRYHLLYTQPFGQNPTLDLWPSYGGMSNHVFSTSGSAYEVTIADSIGANGTFIMWAVDDSAGIFFVPTDYIAAEISHDQPLIWLLGPEGQSEFKLDSTNGSLERALILSSPYPVVRTGLDPNAVQAGQAHRLSIYPDVPLAGTNQLIIRYDDADLKLGDNSLGDEAALAVYHWVDGSTGWVMIGGTVDTVDNAIYAPIMVTGVYAAFTTNIITEIEEDERGDILPYQFELSQNYPNPFNPMTTIEFSILSQTRVTIEIFNLLGQKVRTLVNETKSAGSYRIEWNGSDDAGRPVSTGVYLYRFQASEVVQTKKMLLIK